MPFCICCEYRGYEYRFSTDTRAQYWPGAVADIEPQVVLGSCTLAHISELVVDIAAPEFLVKRGDIHVHRFKT